MVWNLGNKVLTGKDDAKQLEGPAKKFWREFNKETAKEALKETEPIPKIKVPGGNLSLKK